MSSQAYYVTTPIYYASDPPFIGNAWTTVVADALTRFAQIEGKDAYFLTGTDEHGPKVEKSAAAAGIGPKEWVDDISGKYRAMWPTLNIEPSDFIRTTEERHKRVVVELLQRVYDAGDIYLSEKEGLYCLGCEIFYNENELDDGRCPTHGTEPEHINEPNYFFRMSKYYGWWSDYLKENPETIRPERYRNEVEGWLRNPTDLSISRPKSRVTWGIELPFDSDHVAYVWFDALTNYISALGWPDGELFAKYWPTAEHLVGKDILRQHGLYWPIMLKSAGVPIYRHLNVHGFWQGFDGRKMSKSLGNSIDPADVRDAHGADSVRYALLREMPFGLDANIGDAIIAERANSDLANDLGNLASRVLALVQRSFGDNMPPVGAATIEDTNLRDQWLAVTPVVRDAWHDLRMSSAIESVMEGIRATNRYVDSQRPWDLAKSDEIDRLGTVLCTALETLRIASVLFWPIMPERMTLLRKQLGIEKTPQIADAEEWGLLETGALLSLGEQLFPRADVDAARAREQAKADSVKTPEADQADPEETIDFEQFASVKLRVGTIVAADTLPKTSKLLKLQVDLGDETRQIVAGIAESYSADDIVGRQVVVVANLEPATIRGVESQGMLLAADSQAGLRIVCPDAETPAGSPVQ